MTGAGPEGRDTLRSAGSEGRTSYHDDVNLWAGSFEFFVWHSSGFFCFISGPWFFWSLGSKVFDRVLFLDSKGSAGFCSFLGFRILPDDNQIYSRWGESVSAPSPPYFPSSLASRYWLLHSRGNRAVIERIPSTIFFAVDLTVLNGIKPVIRVHHNSKKWM